MCLKTEEMYFQDTKKLFALPSNAHLGFLKKSSKGHIFIKKVTNPKIR